MMTRIQLALGALCASTAVGAAEANPLFKGWYADPQIRRFGDRYWIYPTYSQDFREQTFVDVFSSRNLRTWTKHPQVLTTNEVKWAKGAMWAPDAQEKDGKYYLFFAANDAYPVGGKREDGEAQTEPGIGKYGGIGVAVADQPEGPFHDLIGKPLIDRFWNGAQPIDQYVFRHKDDWYMVYGGWGKCNLVRLAPDFKSLVPFEDGRLWRDITPPGYTEGSVMFERKGVWYFMYSSGGWVNDTYCVKYCTAPSPFGPFAFKGEVLSSQRPIATGAGHHSVLNIPGTDDWYICYHRRPIPNQSRDHRVACLDRMYFNADGSIKPVVMTNGSAADLPPLVGNGVADDTAAIQARLDSGAACVYLPPPEKFYKISKTLRIGSDTELRLDRFSVIRLAPGSDCPMIENKGYVGGDDRRIALTGGVWDMANIDQSPNPQQYRHCKPPREGGLPPKHENDFFFGMAMRFLHVEGMTVKGVTVRNPTSYGMAFCHASYFLIDDITFDYRTCNPIFLNMDGVHLDGWCHHGRISNLRGTCFDDLVALNANDGQCAQEEGDITDVDIDGVYADYCHSAVRLLSTGANLKHVTIRNVHGSFYTYAIGLTHFFGERKTRGVFDDIVISDVFMGKVFSPENIGTHSRTNFPPIWVEGAVDVGSLTISNFNRDERNIPVSTIRVDAPATIGRLTVRDCKVINRLKEPLSFFDIHGKIGELVSENNTFIASPGEVRDVK